MALHEIVARLRIANRLAACIANPRPPVRVIQSMANILRFRLKGLDITHCYKALSEAYGVHVDAGLRNGSQNC